MHINVSPAVIGWVAVVPMLGYMLSIMTLTLASAVVGSGAVITQLLLPMSLDLVPDSQRAPALGIVFSGVLAGILVARTVSGVIGQAFGWRTIFVIAGIAATPGVNRSVF